jgi:hypothetical protein
LQKALNLDPRYERNVIGPLTINASYAADREAVIMALPLPAHICRLALDMAKEKAPTTL